ncbi:hypothetical protein NC652_016583 [Populus alba x Populus x berolinensis]|nr:hypothetical protein NC651_016061 [Populus alba x Populus x berolinensis]KAJ6922973.1 hypothetical protein NC652_016581 [Populus alba x Populus x berolinensis]KAJ6922975.1 hypothetical protein NC652_016583 [Populus alba x Populus x berolinensis]
MMQWLLLVVRDNFEKQPSSSRFQRSIIAVVKVVNDHDSNVVEGPMHACLHCGHFKSTSLRSFQINLACVCLIVDEI